MLIPQSIIFLLSIILKVGNEIGKDVQDTLDLNQKHIPKKQKEESPQPVPKEKKLEKKNSLKNTNFKELHRGLAHSGIFIAGIEMFRKLAPQLQKIFETLNDPEFSLVVTGHSLGGGMTLMMVLLLLVHPLKYFKVNF